MYVILYLGSWALNLVQQEQTTLYIYTVCCKTIKNNGSIDYCTSIPPMLFGTQGMLYCSSLSQVSKYNDGSKNEDKAKPLDL